MKDKSINSFPPIALMRVFLKAIVLTTKSHFHVKRTYASIRGLVVRTIPSRKTRTSAIVANEVFRVCCFVAWFACISYRTYFVFSSRTRSMKSLVAQSFQWMGCTSIFSQEKDLWVSGKWKLFQSYAHTNQEVIYMES